MKQLLGLVLAIMTLLLIFGCGSNPPTQPNANAGVDHTVALVERPQFIETRPPEVVALFTEDMSKVPLAIANKKPPKPPPDDTGSTGDPNPNPAHKYVYIVGISNYEGTANDLNYCDDDARAMKSWYQSEGFTCRVDLDLSATADNIIAGFQWLVDNASPGDEIAFCYSGHGMKSSEGSALVSADLYYITHGYAMSYFNAANCTKKLVTIDACVIGGFHDDVVSGTYMATASNRKNSYDAPDLQQGAWTYYWLNGVEDQNLIYAEDAAPYAEAGMKAWASQYRLRVDPKHSDSYSGEMDM
ncbi:MAG: caspase family protein [candidate division Zixibacteria bacterium]|nr:caspase family protein [candidate division Zixibacteria bacterium]